MVRSDELIVFYVVASTLHYWTFNRYVILAVETRRHTFS